MAHLSKKTKNEVIQELYRSRLDMFGDGQEEDMIMDGFPTLPGLNYMSDLELLEEYFQQIAEERNSLVNKALKEMKLSLREFKNLSQTWRKEGKK